MHSYAAFRGDMVHLNHLQCMIVLEIKPESIIALSRVISSQTKP